MMLIQRMVSSVALVRARARPQQLMQAAQWEQLHIDMSTGAATPLRVFGMAIGESCAVAAELVLHIEARATWMVERAQHATLLVLPIEERPAALRARGSFNDCDHMGDAVVTAACFELELEGNVAGRGQRLHESMGRMRHGDGATGATYDGGAGGMDTRAELVILTAAQSITTGDGIMAARGSATASSITEGCLAPQVQVLRERVLGSAALVDFVGICDDEYCGEARQCGGEFAPAGRVARRLHHRPSGTVRHGARHMEVAVGTPAHHKTLFGYASIGVSACERGWSGGRVSAWSIGGEHWIGEPNWVPNWVQQLQTAN